jgi:glutaconate CoA-transferase subunit A
VLCRLTPDLIYDQMIAAGCARKLVFSWAGNPGAGSLHAFRRAVERGEPPLELEEYSHFGMVARLSAGAARLPFWTLRDYMGTDLPAANPLIRSVTCPYTGELLATVPALNPDVTIVHAQRADASGNAQIWGLLGVQKEAAFASRRVIVVVEELVDEAVIRADPNRTVIPGLAVDAVVVEPWGAHPSYAQGYYDRDNDFYVAWEAISRDPAALGRYLDEYVHGVRDRAEYLEKCNGLERLRADQRVCAGVNYGY